LLVANLAAALGPLFAFGEAALCLGARFSLGGAAFFFATARLTGFAAFFLAVFFAGFLAAFFADFFADFLADFFSDCFAAAALPADFFLAFFAGFLRAMTSESFPGCFRLAQALLRSTGFLDSLALSNVISIGYAERGQPVNRAATVPFVANLRVKDTFRKWQFRKTNKNRHRATGTAATPAKPRANRW
jgi:hypothetical protein